MQNDFFVYRAATRATDLVAELAAAIERGMTAAELAAVIHPHPTFSEMIRGAAETLL